MSAPRARKGGTCRCTTSSRYSRSRRNLPSAASPARVRLVAATTRRSSRRVTFSPTFRISPSCSVRSSFACARGDSSPTSSRKTVPPDEASSRPRRDCTAPVNAPFAWPNSSVSMRSSLNVAQLTAANVSSRRGPSSCSARATSSLPVPLSPSMSTGNGAAAALPTASRSATIASLSPMSRATPMGPGPAPRVSRHVPRPATGAVRSK